MDSYTGWSPRSNETQRDDLEGLPHDDPNPPSHDEPNIIPVDYGLEGVLLNEGLQSILVDNSPARVPLDNSPNAVPVNNGLEAITVVNGLKGISVDDGPEIIPVYEGLEAVPDDGLEAIPEQGILVDDPERIPDNGPEAIFEALPGGRSETLSSGSRRVDPRKPMSRVWWQPFRSSAPGVAGLWSRKKCLVVTIVAFFLVISAVAVGLGLASMRWRRNESGSQGKKPNASDSNSRFFHLKTLSL